MIKCILAVSLKFTFHEHLKEQNLTRMNFYKKAVWGDWNISKEEFYANLSEMFGRSISICPA